MKTRIISAVVAIPLLLFFIIYGRLPLKIATLIISLIGMYELYKAVSGKIKIIHIYGFALELLYFYKWFNSYMDLKLIVCAASVFTVLILFMIVIFHKTNNINDAAITIFGFFYLGILLSLICFIRDADIHMRFVWLPFIFAFGSDTGAYFIGSKFGKHKLTPELSPKKSVEGAIGGIASSAILTTIYGCVVSSADIGFFNIIIYIFAGAVGSVLAQFGDLAASSIKRYVGIKDYGKLMPGHGGVLDRFDSVLFTLPLVYLLTIL